MEIFLLSFLDNIYILLFSYSSENQVKSKKKFLKFLLKFKFPRIRCILYCILLIFEWDDIRTKNFTHNFSLPILLA